ncbi:nicotinamide riboside transporter PnuC [Salinisphaera japonica]|uniref:Nicotinamide riboside transporter PnuC n=1 Tax=Salinisphaera japonica YTM-1 TaxID=1209778 RepID=A0A423PM73_9GAMM|nr:nicotinamide riboside transporter PnuC [Salinisphaera japonica]ROO26632.1 nicotinamide mononucleotide transporter [Salinisphaera japonica YTM-1]
MSTLETIWQGLLGASWIEQAATLLGLVAVWLATRQRIVNFPIGMVQVILTGIIFARSHLFADMTLQAVYFGALAYGWWCWTHPGGHRARLEVSSLAGGHRVTLILGGLLTTAIWGALLVELGDPMPWRDAFIASFGVIAQWLEAHKKLEAWLGWIAVNLAGIGVYAAIGLYWFVGLYTLYLALSFVGFARWQADRARRLVT